MNSHNNRSLMKDIMDEFLSEEGLGSPIAQEVIQWLIYGMTYLSLMLISTLTFGWGAQHFEVFTTNWAISLYFIWLLAWFLILAWQTPLKQVILRSANEIKTLFRW